MGAVDLVRVTLWFDTKQQVFPPKPSPTASFRQQKVA